MNNKAPTTTQIGMPAVSRSPARIAADPVRLLRFARKAAIVFAESGAPNTAAVCEAYVHAMAENHHLRRQLASVQAWSEEPTRRVNSEDHNPLSIPEKGSANNVNPEREEAVLAFGEGPSQP
jgi:hypothetical protein